MKPDVFGHVRLGYVVAESNRLQEWKHFGAEGLGVLVDTDADLVEGLENVIPAMNRLLTGANTGKVIVKLAT